MLVGKKKKKIQMFVFLSRLKMKVWALFNSIRLENHSRDVLLMVEVDEAEDKETSHLRWKPRLCVS